MGVGGENDWEIMNDDGKSKYYIFFKTDKVRKRLEVILWKVSIFKQWKIIFWKSFFRFSPLNPLLRCPRGQKCSSKRFILKCGGLHRILNFQWSDRWNFIDLVPKKLVIVQFHWPLPIKPRDAHINNYI